MTLRRTIKALKALKVIPMHPFRRFQRFQQAAQGAGVRGGRTARTDTPLVAEHPFSTEHRVTNTKHNHETTTSANTLHSDAAAEEPDEFCVEFPLIPNGRN